MPGEVRMGWEALTNGREGSGGPLEGLERQGVSPGGLIGVKRPSRRAGDYCRGPRGDRRPTQRARSG